MEVVRDPNFRVPPCRIHQIGDVFPEQNEVHNWTPLPPNIGQYGQCVGSASKSIFWRGSLGHSTDLFPWLDASLRTHDLLCETNMPLLHENEVGWKNINPFTWKSGNGTCCSACMT